MTFFLVLAALVTGLVWLVDARVFRPRRQRTAGSAAGGTPEPILVEYARSFFPIILLVLVIRSFLFEPFRIPSDSMMPTLLDGDFIFVNKFTYGLRLPVAWSPKSCPWANFEHGDVVVFRLPSDPATNYIERVVGVLPGDHVVVRDKRVWINGELQDVTLDGYSEPYGSTPRAQIGIEHLGTVEHRALYIDERPSVDSTTSCRRVTTTSWATTRNNWPATAGSRRSAACRPATWSARPSASG